MLTKVSHAEHDAAIRTLEQRAPHYTNHMIESQNCLQLETRVGTLPVSIVSVAHGTRYYHLDREFFA